MNAMRLPFYLLALVVLAVPLPSEAETRRVAIVVGDNVGSAADATLRFAENDAAKVADVLVQLGNVDPGDLFLLRGARGPAVRQAIERAAATIDAYRSHPEDRTVLMF